MSEKLTANQLVNVRDIKDIYLYTKSGYVLCYLKVYFYNIDLLSDEDKAAKTDILAKSFDADRKDWVYFSYPREVDLNPYKKHVKSIYDESESFGRKHILSEILQDAVELETNGENYEHQQFIKIWRRAGSDIRETERALRTRITEFKERYRDAGIRTEILQADGIMDMCTLFGNSSQALWDIPSDTVYEPVMMLK